MEGDDVKIARGQWFFAGILVFFGFVSWFLIYLGFYQVYVGFQILIAAFAAIFAFCIIVELSYLLLHPFRFAALLYFLIAALSFLFFQSIFSVGIFFLTTLLGYISVKKEQKLFVHFSYTRVIRSGLPIFFTGLAMAMAIFYNSAPIGQISEVPQFSEKLMRAILVPVEYALKPSIPEFNKDMRIKDVGNISARELPRFINLPPAVITGIVKDFFAKLPRDLRNKTITEFLRDIVNSQLRATLLPYKQFLPFIYLFGLFFVFKGLGMPLMWLSIAAGWAVTKILLQFNVLKIKKINIEKEELVL